DLCALTSVPAVQAQTTMHNNEQTKSLCKRDCFTKDEITEEISKDWHGLIKRCHERCFIGIECVEVANSGEGGRHSGRDKRSSLNQTDMVRIRLNEQNNRNRDAAEQRRRNDNGSNTFLPEIS